jgi:hypothetical protein
MERDASTGTWTQLSWLRRKNQMEPQRMTRSEQRELRMREAWATMPRTLRAALLDSAHGEALAQMTPEAWRLQEERDAVEDAERNERDHRFHEDEEPEEND